MISKQKYIEAIKKLPIENPIAEDPKVRILFPHLTDDEVRAVLQPNKKGNSNYVAIPALRVNGGFQIVSFVPELIEEIKVRRHDTRAIKGTKKHPAKLKWSYAGRTKESYVGRGGDRDVFHNYTHMDKAIEFARKNWGSDLVLDNWVDFITIQLDDPSKLDDRKYPTFAGNIYFTTNREWNKIINDHSKPESQLIDDSIVEATTNFQISHELKGGRGGYLDFNCGYCSSGLGLTGCGGCGYTFRDDQFRCGWSTPLPSKLVRLLTSEGFKFKKDPQIALQKEAERFKELEEERAAYKQR